MNRTGSGFKWMAGFLAAVFVSFQGRAADFVTECWRVAEVPLAGSVAYPDPFQSVDVTATFTGPGGQTIVRPGFWDGGNTWRVRFAPTVVGQWTMTTSCSDPSNAGLHGISRTIQCDPYTGPLSIYRHGFIKPSSNGRHFVHADGTPFFYLGDTHWLFIHERFDTSNVPGVPSQFKYTVDKRVDQGFTVFQTEAIHNPHGGTHGSPSEEPHADLRDGMTAEDLPGFANIDRKFAYIAEKGLVHANSMITWAAEPAEYPIFTENYMARLGKYWAARYGAYPVLWTVAQEIDTNFYGAYNSATIGRWHAGAKATTDNDPYFQPLGAHMQSISNGINYPTESSWADKPYHAWWPMQLQYNISANTWRTAAKEFVQSSPPKPVVLYESPYDTFWTDAKGARSSGYRAFQTGMCGYGYGANGTWNDLFELGDYGTDYFMPAGYLSWHDGANLPGGTQMSHLKNFYSSLDWWKLAARFDDPDWSNFPDPDHSLLSSEGDSTYVAYFFGEGKATGTIKGMAAAPYEAFWFDPRTGARSALGGVIPVAGQWSVPSRPTADDWVLLVRQKPSALVVSPANGGSFSPSLVSRLTWTDAGANPGLSYQVYLGSAESYDIEKPNGNLARLTPLAGTSAKEFPLPSSLPAGVYCWLLVVSDTSSGTTVSHLSTFTIAGSSIPVENGSFETTGVAGVAQGWARIDTGWNSANTGNAFQQNSLTPSTGAHFSTVAAGGGVWSALMNGNTGSIRRGLGISVNAGDTLSVTFHGGRARAEASTAAGGVFLASFIVGNNRYGMQVDTTLLANNEWQTYTLTRTVTNAGYLDLEFSAVSGDPWLDHVGDVTLSTPAVLSISMVNPVDGAQVLSGAPLVATAEVLNGNASLVVGYEISGPEGTTVLPGTGGAPSHPQALGVLSPGGYQIRATVTGGAGNPASATSLPVAFHVGTSVTVPVINGNFETPGDLTTKGWARAGAVWNPSVTNDYQQLSSRQHLTDCHFSAASPGGGSWYTLMSGNTGSIQQDLHTMVKPGDVVSVTFYGGRGRSVMSTSAGGTFNATFLVGTTAYTMLVDTTLLANDRWQSYTLTKTIENTGNLSLAFSKAAGDPWLDNISDVTITPVAPFTSWIRSRVPSLPADQKGFSGDPDRDGVANGLVWMLGGNNPLSNNLALLPLHQRTPDGGLTLVFDCLRQADRGNATLAVEYGNNIDGWLPALVPEISAVVNGVDFTVIGTGTLHVMARIPKVRPDDSRLFCRLKATSP